MAQLVGTSGRVYSFDIQETAIANTKARLSEHNCLTQATLIQASHENVKSLISVGDHGNIAGCIFNLGYLPGGDKQIVTKAETTLTAISDIFSLLKKEAIIVLVIYHGHNEGKKEKDQLLKFVTTLDQTKAHVLTYHFLNQKNNPPFIIAIEKN